VALTAAAGGIAAATYMTTRSAAPEPTPASQVSAQQSPPAEAAADQSRGTIDGQPLSASTNA
jgi:hypothetical protein